ncbi:hypothetical protein F53441_11446 [Fusarium austroafricanum]|uniref:3CxxC-type domain-containing protein n=1 Tax=Fusarium austroafricanum TaxID=2364996 RepID=A0A8H4K4C1_9HYPO|nr:hypothetical protein F53441_11446 [Fusarium austroafricanum]
MPPKGTKKPSPWSMYPNLHDQVADKLEEVQLDYSFFEHDNDHGTIQTYDTNIMGRFTCHNQKCSTKGWSSKVIAVTIRTYSRDRYNVRVYHQRCKRCDRLGRPTIDEKSYIDRVVYRIKKWNGVDVEIPFFSEKKTQPHEMDFCEGCKAGHCLRGKMNGSVDYLFD